MEFMRITSAANPSIKLAKNLAQHSRAARKEGLSLAEGIHLARELLSHPELVRQVFLREGAEQNFGNPAKVPVVEDFCSSVAVSNLCFDFSGGHQCRDSL